MPTRIEVEDPCTTCCLTTLELNMKGHYSSETERMEGEGRSSTVGGGRRQTIQGYTDVGESESEGPGPGRPHAEPLRPFSPRLSLGDSSRSIATLLRTVSSVRRDTSYTASVLSVCTVPSPF